VPPATVGVGDVHARARRGRVWPRLLQGGPLRLRRGKLHRDCQRRADQLNSVRVCIYTHIHIYVGIYSIYRYMDMFVYIYRPLCLRRGQLHRDCQWRADQPKQTSRVYLHTYTYVCVYSIHRYMDMFIYISSLAPAPRGAAPRPSRARRSARRRFVK